MATISPGAGKLKVYWRQGTEQKSNNVMYTPVNLIGTATQTVTDSATGSDVTVTTADVIMDLDDFFSGLITATTSAGAYEEVRVSYTAKMYHSNTSRKLTAYGGDDVEPEIIEEKKSDGEEVVDLKGGDKK